MKINYNDKPLLLSLDKMVKAMPQKVDRALSLTAQEGVNIILNRTEKGKGINRTFPPYSEKYAKFRAKRGRKITPVDLNFSGEMLASLSSRKINRNTQRISFNRATEAKKAVFNNQRRPFFGFSKTEKTRLSRIFKRQVAL